MQIESLKVFCDLAETQSFTKAAKINAVTQSAVSQQIGSLERMFESLLIERSKRRFRLTREGEVFYDFSKQIIQNFEVLFSKLQETKRIISGQKFVGFEPDIPTRRAIDKVFKEHRVAVQHVMEFDNIETVKRAVEIEAGIAIVPQGTVLQEIEKQTLAGVEIEGAVLYRPL